MTKSDDSRATQGCALLLGWALVTGGIAIAVGAVTHPALGLAIWLTANGAPPLLTAGAADKRWQ